MAGGGFFFRMLDMTDCGKLFNFRASVTWINSFAFPLGVLGRVGAQLRRVMAVLSTLLHAILITGNHFIKYWNMKHNQFSHTCI